MGTGAGPAPAMPQPGRHLLANRDFAWKGYRIVLAILSVTVLAMTAANGPAKADDWPDHDRRIEQWAAQRISGKLGELRGSFGDRASLDAIIGREQVAAPKRKIEPLPRIFVRPTTTPKLPPVVQNDMLPPGVDPMITGSNAHPTGAARRDAMIERRTAHFMTREPRLLFD